MRHGQRGTQRLFLVKIRGTLFLGSVFPAGEGGDVLEFVERGTATRVIAY